MIEVEQPRCPRCQSPNVTFASGLGMSGYRKCIVCGNCWRPVSARKAAAADPPAGKPDTSVDVSGDRPG